ncbi:MAG TPA: hypothetical protein PLQ76_07145 [bacterium]|nr:hypothetical protein [bacterium]
MVKIPVYFFCALFFLFCAGNATASQKKVVTPKAAISVNYWGSSLYKSFPTRNEKSKQGFFPVFIGAVKVADRLSATGEWGKSGYSVISPSRQSNLPEKASRTVLGVKYDVMPGVYAALSFPYMKLQQDNDLNYKMTATISGVQIGGGLSMYIKEPHLGAGLEFNMVPRMNVKYVSPTMRSKADGTGMDIKVLLSYKFNDPRFSIHAGYRYMSLNAGEALVSGVTAVPSVNYRLRGPFMGVKYAF